MDLLSLSMARTGFPGLDKILNNLWIGDNVVFRINNIEDYSMFTAPFVKASINDGKKVVYMRYASHMPLIENNDKVTVYNIDSHKGFENFLSNIHNIITLEGKGVFYVFDCLSDLLSSWATDLMIGNFFMVICPYLYKLDTIAYFSLLKEKSSYETTANIRDTTQVLLDVHRTKGSIYVHPLKVWNRYSPTMFFPHEIKGRDFIPITGSGDAARIFADSTNDISKAAARHLDNFEWLFIKASELNSKIKSGKTNLTLKEKNMIEKLCRILFGNDDKLLTLTKQYFSLEDILNIKSRLVGSGFIGGKAVGMLLARQILKHDEHNYDNILEHHDSFFIGSDVFYTYLVKNNLWKLKIDQKRKENYFSIGLKLKEEMLLGTFPQNIRQQFINMLEYYGQSPIIVRSSSLLEDSFGNAFAGKYESIFCINQGSPKERYRKFEDAVRTIYSSTMDKEALAYRKRRGLENKDEQMSLLIQRVSGKYHKKYFFPDAAGVGVSYNTYVWKKDISPKAGMLRLVAGLGTRAVNRVDGDYARIVALDKPEENNICSRLDLKRFSQHDLDVLDMEDNMFASLPLQKLVDEGIEIRLDMTAVRDYDTEDKMRRLNLGSKNAYLITFKKLICKTDFIKTIRKMMKTIEKKYEYPVDIEFTVNFSDDNYRINLVQCRPLQTKGINNSSDNLNALNSNINILFKINGGFMGCSIINKIDKVIYVDPKHYSTLPENLKYETARIIGKINEKTYADNCKIMLMGPGRWGTTIPSMGIPVNFSEICNTSLLCEISLPTKGLSPDLSFGTHFFQDLVESEMNYAAIYPEKKDCIYNINLLDKLENQPLPSEITKLTDVIKVFDLSLQKDICLKTACDIKKQELICYLEYN